VGVALLAPRSSLTYEMERMGVVGYDELEHGDAGGGARVGDRATGTVGGGGSDGGATLRARSLSGAEDNNSAGLEPPRSIDNVATASVDEGGNEVGGDSRGAQEDSITAAARDSHGASDGSNLAAGGDSRGHHPPTLGLAAAVRQVAPTPLSGDNIAAQDAIDNHSRAAGEMRAGRLRAYDEWHARAVSAWARFLTTGDDEGAAGGHGPRESTADRRGGAGHHRSNRIDQRPLRLEEIARSR
jgi:hypothetical protein